MMPLSLPLLLSQCAILLVSFEGTVCPLLDFVIDCFSIADIYDTVEVMGSGETAQFVFKKSADGVRKHQHVVPFSAILDHTFTREGNNPSIVSFSLVGQYPHVNYNIKFEIKWQARFFATNKTLPAYYKISWARIYSYLRPVIASYDNLDDDDVGFKFLDNGDYSDPDERLLQLPYIFKHSEIQREIRTTLPHTLYLRSKIREQDYMLVFRSTDDLGTFLNFFPKRRYEDRMTAGYYFMYSLKKFKN